MLYQRSFEIEHRLETVLDLIRTGQYSTPMLAQQLGVSIPTVSRYVSALRQRGYDICAERIGNGWRYSLGKIGTTSGRVSARAVTAASVCGSVGSP